MGESLRKMDEIAKNLLLDIRNFSVKLICKRLKLWAESKRWITPKKQLKLIKATATFKQANLAVDLANGEVDDKWRWQGCEGEFNK